jgi:hypothetical protein
MFFRQVLGRIIRGVPEESAYFYLPADERLITFAQEIQEERDHELQQEIVDTGPGPGSGGTRTSGGFAPVSSTGHAHDVIAGSDVYTQDEIAEAANLGARAKSKEDTTKIAQMIRLYKEAERKAQPQQTGQVVDSSVLPVVSPQSPSAPRVLHEEKKKLKDLINRLVNGIVAASNGKLTYEDVHRELNERDGVRTMSEATEEQLQGRINYLGEWDERMHSRRVFDGD